MKSVLTYKLKGSSIIEVLIALALTSFCASLAAIIYLNLQKSSLPFFKVKAVELAEYCMQQTKEKHLLMDENYSAEEFTVKKTISTSETFPDCSLVRVFVFDGSKKKIVELESLIKR